MNREHVLAVLYDLAMVVGGEVKLRPLLTRSVQRLLYHTSFPVGLVFLHPFRPAGDAVEARLELAIGDYALSALVGRTLALPGGLLQGEAACREDPALLAALAAASRYDAFLRLPIPQQGVILLLAPRAPPPELQLQDMFKPILANLARAIMLCREHEAHEAGLVAERDAARVRLEESAETLRAMGEAALDAIVMCDGEGRVSYWNPAAARTFGHSAAEITGRKLHEALLPARHREEVEEAFRRFGETGSGRVLGITRELEAVRKDGTEFPIELSLSPLMLRGRPGAVGIVRDISERRRIEEQLRRSQRLDALGQLAGGVAHDFNNLLVVINGYCELAIETLPQDSALRADLEQVRAAGTRGAALTRQLLAFGRKQMLKPVVLSLNTVVSDLDGMLRRVIGEDVELRVKLAPDLGNVLADPSQLEQVLVNLVMNARDAMPSGGKLAIETRNSVLDEARVKGHPDARPGAYVVLAVSDTGHGMDPATMARIFEPFFTTKLPGKGTGLGLSTVYGIVRQSGGLIDVRSEVGKGTSVRIYLPRESRAASALHPAPAPGPSRFAGRETILVVEDDPGVRALVSRVLQPLGYEVITAATPAEALQASASRGGPIQLLLTDVVMPGMDGRDLAARLAGERGDMAVLFMSGHPRSALALHGGLPADVGLVEKPFTAAELAQKVREALRRGGAWRERLHAATLGE